MRADSISRRCPARRSRWRRRSAACSPPTSPRRSMCRRSTAPMSMDFAVRAADIAGASDAAPRRFRSQRRGRRLRHVPAHGGDAGSATTIATGGVVPRGADAVDHDRANRSLWRGRGTGDRGAPRGAPGQFISYAGSDIARGEVVLRRGTRIGSREIGMLAACGIAEVEVVRRPRVAVLSTGDELGVAGRRAGTSAGLRQQWCDRRRRGRPRRAGEPMHLRRVSGRRVGARARDTRGARRPAIWLCSAAARRKARAIFRTASSSRLGAPGVIVHGVALKPGKPLCLAVT